MTKIIQLDSTEYRFEIDLTNANWCQYWLTNNEIVIYLGAEKLPYLKEHLLSGFSESAEESMGRLEGMNISWVLSLAETHHVLYVSTDTEDKTLIWQNAHSTRNPTYRMRISKDELSKWRSQLETLK